MQTMPSKITQEIDKELKKIGYRPPRIALLWRGKLLLFALKHKNVGAFLINHLEVGDLKTPDGTKYKGFKFSWRW